MTLVVTHAKVTSGTLDNDVEVDLGDWNDNHTITGSVAASEITSGAALTRVDDTNVTLTLGGTPTTALLAATSVTVGWTGTLAPSRGGTGVANNAASTITISGSFGTTFTVTATTSVTLPTSGTLATTAGLDLKANLAGGNSFTGDQTFDVSGGVVNRSFNVITDDAGVTNASYAAICYGGAGAGFGGGQFHGGAVQGTKAAPTAAVADQMITGLGGLIYTGAAWTSSSPASCHYVLLENATATAHGACINWYSTALGSAAAARVNSLSLTQDGTVHAKDNSAGFSATSTLQTKPSSDIRILASGVNASIGSAGYGQQGGLHCFRASGTVASPTATEAAASLGFFGARGYTTNAGAAWGVGSTGLFRYVSAEAGAFTTTAQGTYAVAGTTPIGSVTRSDWFFLQEDGSLGVGVGTAKTGAGTVNALTNYYVNGTLLRDLAETLTSKILTAPDINGGTADALTSLGIRSTGAAFDLKIASAEVLTANRTLTVDLNDAARTIDLTGNLILAGSLNTAGSLTTSGSFASTFTMTGTTTVTFPETGTLATFDNVIRYDAAQSITDAQKKQARANAGVEDHNHVINSSGVLYQSGLGSQTDGTYDFDQWVVLTQSAAVTSSQVADAEDGTPYMMRLTQSDAGAQRFGRIQWLEKLFCRKMRGQSVVLSARVRMSASTTLRYAIVEWTGTADTITKDVVLDWTNGTFTAGQFFTTTSTTIVGAGSIALTANTLTDITALTGAVSSSMNNIAVFFWTDSTQAQNVTLDIGNVKFEEGAVATTYHVTPYHEEFIDCNRYYFKTFDIATTPAQDVGINLGDFIWPASATGAATNRSPKILFPVRMRISPTVTGYNPDTANAQARDQTASADCSATTFVVSDNGLRIGCTGAAGTAVGNALGVHFAASARL